MNDDDEWMSDQPCLSAEDELLLFKADDGNNKTVSSYDQSEIEILHSDPDEVVVVLPEYIKQKDSAPKFEFYEEQDRAKREVKRITSNSGKKNSKKKSKNQKLFKLSKKRSREQWESADEQIVQRIPKRRRKEHNTHNKIETNSQDDNEEDTIHSLNVDPQEEEHLVKNTPEREGTSTELIDKLKAPIHRLNKEEVQYMKVLSSSFDGKMYGDETTLVADDTKESHGEGDNGEDSWSSCEEHYKDNNNNNSDDEELNGDDDDGDDDDDSDETSLEKLRLSDLYDEEYHKFANSIFKKSQYTFDDISLVSTIEGRPCILLFNSTSSKRFPTYCYRLKENTRLRILSKFNSAWQSTLASFIHRNEMDCNPEIFYPEEKSVPVAKSPPPPPGTITNPNEEATKNTTQQKYETKHVMSEEAKLFYYTTSYRVIEAYYQHSIDRMSKEKMFLDPLYSLKRFPTMCWGFDFSQIFDLLRKNEPFSKYADGFDSSKFVSSILTLYPTLEDEEKVILSKIKEMARFKRAKKKAANKEKKQENVENEQQQENDEEIDDFYSSFSDSTASVVTDDDEEGDNDGEDHKNSNNNDNGKWPKPAKTTTGKHTAKRAVKYWIEIFLPRIDYKDFIKPKESRIRKKRKKSQISSKPKRKNKFEEKSEQIIEQFNEDLSTEVVQSSPPLVEENDEYEQDIILESDNDGDDDDDMQTDDKTKEDIFLDESNLKKPKNSVIYHRDRVLPIPLLPFFIDSLPPKKRINNSAANVVFRLLDCLRKFRNEIVTGGTKPQSNSSSISSFGSKDPVFFHYGSYINNGSTSSNMFNVEVASLDATILQLEVNFEKLLFGIHSRNIELHFVAQSLAYDTRDALNIQTKCIDDHHKKFKTMYTKLSRISRITATNKQNIGSCLKSYKALEKMQQEVKDLRKDVIQLKKFQKRKPKRNKDKNNKNKNKKKKKEMRSKGT